MSSSASRIRYLLVFVLASVCASKGLVTLDLYHSSDLQTTDKLAAREVDSILDNEYSWYGIKLAIGTPPQLVLLQVDTGSSDLWVGNQFSASSSSTYHPNLTDPFTIQYGDGSSASGIYAQDTMTLADMNITLKQVNFGYAATSQVYPQVCGVGLASNEASQGHKYSNLPMQLKEQGFISAMVYSMRLGSYTAPGQLVFGGVDHSQYEGTLQAVPLVSSTSFSIQLNEILLNNRTVYSTPQPALLDSGTTNLLLPTDMISAIINSIEPEQKWVPGNGYAVQCTSITAGSYFEFDFSGARIRLPFKNIVDPASLTTTGDVPTSGTCGLGIQISSDDTPVILGDRFLVGTYAVYDIDHHQVALANVRDGNSPYSNSTTSPPQLEPVQNNGLIPGAEEAPFYSSILVPSVAGRVAASSVPETASESVLSATLSASNAAESNTFESAPQFPASASASAAKAAAASAGSQSASSTASSPSTSMTVTSRNGAQLIMMNTSLFSFAFIVLFFL